LNCPAALRRLSLLALLAVLALMGGCAAQSAFREGRSLMAEGRLPEAIARFEEASRLDPRSAEYRIAWGRARDRLLAERLATADRALEQGDLPTAEAGYRSVLAEAGTHERALGGLRQVDARRRWQRSLVDAEAAAARKDWDLVRTHARAVLLENPRQPRAISLLEQADAATTGSAERVSKALDEAYRKPISIEFRDTPLKTVFEVISRSTGLNFVFDKDVRGDQRTSVYLRDSTTELVVTTILLANQLEQRVINANTLLIYPAAAAKQKDYQPLVVRSFFLANADAKAVAATLKQLLKVREATVDERLNLVVVRDSVETVRLAEKVVALHDVPEAEVMLEVEILEVKRTRLLDLGVRWPDQLSLAPLASSAGAALTLTELRNLNSSTIGATVGSASINARNLDTDANILANPRIRARNREKARIHIGERVPNITSTATSTGFVSESVNYVDVGLKLDVEPTIHLDNEVAIKVALEVSNIINQVQTRSGTLAYQIGTRSATSVLRLKDGENQVLAGLISDEDRRTANKVPGLGEVPLLGRLFGNQADDSSKTEIVLSITPRVVRNVQRPAAALLEFDSGTESGVGGRGAAPSPTPVPPGPRLAAAAPTAGQPTASTPAATSATTGATTGVTTGGTALAAAPLTGAQPSSVSTRFAGPTESRPGELLALQLLASSDQPVTSLQAMLGFDPTVLQLVSVTEGDFLRQGGVSTSFSTQAGTPGRVVVNMARNGSGGAQAAAVLLTLNLRPLRVTTTPSRVELLQLAPMGLNGVALGGQALPAQLIRVVP
jgi:general secretion pathway protein D